MKKPKINHDPCKTAADLLAAVVDSKKAEAVPVGWMTAEQIAESSGRSGSHCRYLISEGMKAGVVEFKKFRIFAGDRIRPVKHYRKITK